MPILPLNFPFLFEICCISFLCLQSNLGNLKKKYIYYLTVSVVRESKHGLKSVIKVLAGPHFFLELRVLFQAHVIVGRIQFLLALRLRSHFLAGYQPAYTLSSQRLPQIPAHGPLMPLSQHGSLLLQTQPRNLLLQNKMQSHIVYCNHRSDCLIIFATLC